MTKYKVGDVLTWDDDFYDPKVEYTVINTDKNTRKYELEYIDPTTTNKETYWYPSDFADRGKVSLVGSTTSTAKIVSTTIPASTEASLTHKYRCPKCHQLTVSLMFTHYICDRCKTKFTANELFPTDNDGY